MFLCDLNQLVYQKCRNEGMRQSNSLFIAKLIFLVQHIPLPIVML